MAWPRNRFPCMVFRVSSSRVGPPSSSSGPTPITPNSSYVARTASKIRSSERRENGRPSTIEAPKRRLATAVSSMRPPDVGAARCLTKRGISTGSDTGAGPHRGRPIAAGELPRYPVQSPAPGRVGQGHRYPRHPLAAGAGRGIDDRAVARVDDGPVEPRPDLHRLPRGRSMDTFAALCDILDCTPNDLIEVEAV